MRPNLIRRLDTNILIAALISQGTPPDGLYRAWLRGSFDLVTCPEQIAELAEVLVHPRLQRFLDADEAAAIAGHIDTRAIVIADAAPVTFSPDPDDNPILAAAIAGNADLTVSGDKRHMLVFGQGRGDTHCDGPRGDRAAAGLTPSLKLICAIPSRRAILFRW